MSFKEYDIRGIYPTEIDEKFAYDLGKALALYFNDKIAVGQDVRLSSNSLQENLIKGINDAGKEVIDVGVCSSPVMAFISKEFDSVIVTASHNPKEYNGFKILRKGVIDVGLPNGLLKIKELMDKPLETIKKGCMMYKDYTEKYLDYISRFADLQKRLKIVVDAGNGVQGPIIKQLFDEIEADLIPLFFEQDGEFPGRGPNPSNLSALKDKILQEKADLGLGFDCDGDRIIFVDEQGDIVPSEAIILMLAKKLAKKDDIVIATVNCSRSIEEFAEKQGFKVIRCPVGRTNVAAEMRKNNAIVGGEVSGHFFFKDFFFKDDATVTMLTVMSQLSKEDKPFSKIVEEFLKYPSERSDIKVSSRDKIEKIFDFFEEKFSKGIIDKMDGLKISFDDWWFNIRASKTEPVLRLTIEADNKTILTEKTQLLTSLIEAV